MYTCKHMYLYVYIYLEIKVNVNMCIYIFKRNSISSAPADFTLLYMIHEAYYLQHWVLAGRPCSTPPNIKNDKEI